MNNNYFYKLASIADHWGDMKKYGAGIIDAGRKVAASAPKISSSTTTPTTSMQSTTSSSSTSNTSAGTGTSAPPQTPATPTSQPGMVGYRPQTPEDLVNHWVAQKEHYYRNRTDKFADRYKDYTVSPEAKRLMAREAQKIWGEIGNDPSKLEASHLEREGAFNTAMKRNETERDERQQKQQAEAQGTAPMQNPTSDSAIPNPSAGVQPISALPIEQRARMGQEIVQKGIGVNGFHPDTLSPQRRELRSNLNQQLAPIFSQNGVMSPLAQYYYWMWQLGMLPYGSEQERVNQLMNVYTDSQHFPEYTRGPGYAEAFDNYRNSPDWTNYTYY